MEDGHLNGQQESQELTNTRWRTCLSASKKVLNLVLAQWLVIGFGLSCLLAYFFPGNDRFDFLTLILRSSKTDVRWTLQMSPPMAELSDLNTASSTEVYQSSSWSVDCSFRTRSCV